MADLKSSYRNQLSKDPPVKIFPDEVIFKDIKASQSYEINISVRNITKKVKKVRIGQPTTSKFRCDYDMVASLASGIAMELIVSFSTNVLGIFHDKILVYCDDDYTAEIP